MFSDRGRLVCVGLVFAVGLLLFTALIPSNGPSMDACVCQDMPSGASVLGCGRAANPIPRPASMSGTGRNQRGTVQQEAEDRRLRDVR
jgi:hypothetical protein